MSAYQKLVDIYQQSHPLTKIRSVLLWDTRVMMPSGAALERARMMKALEQAIGMQLRKIPVEDLLQEASIETLDEWQAANLRLMKRDYARHRAVPDDLAQELNASAFAGLSIWPKAKENNDWAAMQPVFARIVKAERKKIAILGDVMGITPYEVCLFDFVRGYSTASLNDSITWAMTRLSPLVKARKLMPPVEFPRISRHRQLKICRTLLGDLGFDFNRGRIDASPKAFHVATDEDSRIGLKVQSRNVWGTISSAIHEMGHSLHRLNTPRKHVGEPVGTPGDFALRESMAFIWQVHAARTPEFLGHAASVICEISGETISAEELSHAAWMTTRGPERSRADPAAYLLHIGIRFMIEQELLVGGLDVAEVPQRWAELYDEWLGVEVPNNTQGCLQDIHWYKGAFGYFPAYALGHIYAAAMMEKAESEIPEWRLSLTKGIGHPLVTWLDTHVYQYANLYSGRVVIESALGRQVNVDSFLDRLVMPV